MYNIIIFLSVSSLHVALLYVFKLLYMTELSIRKANYIKKKNKKESFFSDMCCFVMFVAAVCLLFLLKLKWPKNKSVENYKKFTYV